MGLSTNEQTKLDKMCPVAQYASVGSILAGLQKQLVPLAYQGTLGYDAGPGSDGVLFGALTDQDVAAAIADDGGSMTDETTEATEGTGNDMTLLPATPAVDDAYYFGYAKPFNAVVLQITTQGAGTWTITWEYWNGSAWAALTVEDGTVGFTASAATYLVSFAPPAAWQVCEVNEQGPFYYVRARVSAYTSVTTQPLGGQAWVLDLLNGTGLRMPAAGTVTGVQFTADTASGSTGDSVIVVINLTNGTCVAATWTKAQVIDRVEGLGLAFEAGDQLAVRQVLEDGSTEFAGANIVLEVTYA